MAKPREDAKVTVSARVPFALRVQLKIFCARTNNTEQAVVEAALRAWLKERA